MTNHAYVPFGNTNNFKPIEANSILSTDFGSIGEIGNQSYGVVPANTGGSSLGPTANADTPTSSVGEGTTGFNPYIQGIQAFSGLANAYLGFKSLELGRDQFGFAKDSFNKNLANQAQTINTRLEDTQRARLPSTGEYDRNTAEGQAALQADLEKYTAANRVSGTAI